MYGLQSNVNPLHSPRSEKGIGFMGLAGAASVKE